MMPRVSFTRSADGVSIAYTTLGDGPPLVLMPALLFSHLEKLWDLPRLRVGLEALGEHWTVVRYDNRGCGLSDRDATDYTLDAHVYDLEAVVAALELHRFALNAPLLAGPVGIAYAAKHPKRVTNLILQTTIASGAAASTAQLQAVLGLVRQDWGLFTETAARFALQWGDEALAREAAPILRECVSQDTAAALLEAAAAFDVVGLLPQVKAPTLVIHNRQFPLELATARDLASRIPNARLSAIDNLESVTPAIVEFLSGDEAVARSADTQTPAPSDPSGLSDRELEVLRLVAAGKSNRQIADELVISPNTVDRHVSHILAKIGAANRAEAAAYAAKQRLL